MTDQIREQISAFLDGELAPEESSLLVRRLERDPELRNAFGRYVLAGESLRSPAGPLARPGFAARVGAALDQGASVPVAEAPTTARVVRQGVKRPLATFAVAAGAALAAVLLIRPDSGQAPVAGSASPTRTGALALVVGGASPTAAQSQRLAGYLVAHGQYASPMGRRNAWSNALASDPGIQRPVVYEAPEKP
jgi:sigma-E factor negative regulatory protein RseA